jgi:hypothetical protein
VEDGYRMGTDFEPQIPAAAEEASPKQLLTLITSTPKGAETRELCDPEKWGLSDVLRKWSETIQYQLLNGSLRAPIQLSQRAYLMPPTDNFDDKFVARFTLEVDRIEEVRKHQAYHRFLDWKFQQMSRILYTWMEVIADSEGLVDQCLSGVVLEWDELDLVSRTREVLGVTSVES